MEASHAWSVEAGSEAPSTSRALPEAVALAAASTAPHFNFEILFEGATVGPLELGAQP